jgi:cytochrome c biogenesis factor
MRICLFLLQNDINAYIFITLVPVTIPLDNTTQKFSLTANYFSDNIPRYSRYLDKLGIVYFEKIRRVQMRVVSILVAVLGLLVLAMGVIFITQASSAEKQVADEIQPLKVADVNATYDSVKVKQTALQKAEGAAIQAGNPSITYTYLTLQRTSLGLTKSNLGLAKFIRTIGILNIVLGVSLLVLGFEMMGRRKTR